MRGGWTWTLGVLALLLIAAGGRAQEEFLFLNGESVSLDSPAVRSDAGFLVPLREFGVLIGLEVSEGVGGRLDLRWNGGRETVDASGLPNVDGVSYASLDWLVGLAGGVVLRLGAGVYVETDPVALDELDVTEERIVLRFAGFVPIEILPSDESSFRLRFHHCEPPFPHRSVILADGPMTRIDAQSAFPSAVEIYARLREASALRLTRLEAADFYAVTIEADAEPSAKSTTVIAPDRELHEVNLILSGGAASVVYAYVEAWRSSYRLEPGGSSFELGDLAFPLQIASEGSGDIAIGAGRDLGSLVIDGVPFRLPAEETTLLASDAFGRLSSIRGAVRAVLRAEGVDVPIDDVNRPLRYGEAVAYPPGYRGEIKGGTTGGFTVLKIRSGCVVSVYRGSFVDEDPTATLVVASGEARARLAGISLGDDARLVCLVEGAQEPLVDALTIEGVLLSDGLPADGDVADDGSLRAWSVIAADWHGGLILLSIPRNDRSAGATSEEVLALLGGFDVPVKDAFVLASEGSSTLVVDHNGLHAFGDADRVAVALLLVPIGE
jgi:hypothetical protein